LRARGDFVRFGLGSHGLTSRLAVLCLLHLALADQFPKITMWQGL
jgi:hypothetical protein